MVAVAVAVALEDPAKTVLVLREAGAELSELPIRLREEVDVREAAGRVTKPVLRMFVL